MAGYSDLIKRGILENDMALVVKGYNAMFGEKVEMPSKRRAEDVDDGGTTGTGVKNPRSVREQVKISKVNLFVDEEGEKRASAKAVVPIKKKKTVKRNGESSTTTKTVKCVGCGESSKIRRDLVDGTGDSEYTCSDCIVSRRR